MNFIDLTCDFNYEAAHWLPDVPEGHQCGRTHGHSYKLEVTVCGPILDNGFVIDFADLKSLVRDRVVRVVDHQLLNDIEGLSNPTVELQLVWIWNRLSSVPGLHKLVLHETPNNRATYYGRPS